MQLPLTLSGSRIHAGFPDVLADFSLLPAPWDWEPGEQAGKSQEPLSSGLAATATDEFLQPW